MSPGSFMTTSARSWRRSIWKPTRRCRRNREMTASLRDEMTRLCHRLRGILRDVEQTAYRLHPSSLDHLGLSVALKSYCADFAKQNGIDTRCTERNLPRAIPPRLGLTVYRVVQEALRNVAKHSGARRAAVSVAGKNGTISADHQGFRPRVRPVPVQEARARVDQHGGAGSPGRRHLHDEDPRPGKASASTSAYPSRGSQREGARILKAVHNANRHMTRRPRLLLADDHPLFLEGVRRLLENKYDVVGAVADGKALITAAQASSAGHHRGGHLHA